MTTGSCACGQIRFECQGSPSILCLCHCRLCRQTVGASPVGWAFKDWIDESYRAQAPKKLVASLGGNGGNGRKTAKTARRR